jgi:hypothetical protein
MARYRKIDVRIWNDAKFCSLSERGKLAFFFLLTHPHLTMVGAMRASIPGLAAEVGMDLEVFQKAFREISAKSMAALDENTCFLWLPNFLKYNRPESPNVVRAWPQALELLPECEMKSALCGALRSMTEGLSISFREAYAEVFGKGTANQKQEHQQKQEPQNRALRLLEAQPGVPKFKSESRLQPTYQPIPAWELSPACESAWHQICDYLEHNLNRHSFDTWIAPLRNRVLGDSRGVLYVAVPTPNFKHVDEKYGALMKNAIEQHGLTIEKIEFVPVPMARNSSNVGRGEVQTNVAMQ